MIYRDATFAQWSGDSLVWLPERGMGFFPVKDSPYDAAYFAKYQGYAATEMGRALTQARIELVARHWRGELVDVGIGCGDFVAARTAATAALTLGCDVNPLAIDWLNARCLWLDPAQESVAAASFWDSLEHIPQPDLILANVRKFVFVSLPIFADVDHVLRSRHYRRDEHCWYWTRAGFLAWMAAQGWQPVEHNVMETALGREDIETFAFKRQGAPS